MKQAEVYNNRVLAGTLTQTDSREYIFRYDDDYFANPTTRSISLTLTKEQQEYHSDILFPFFFNMLSEGSNRAVQSRLLRIDPADHFGILLATAGTDTIGAITVKPIDNDNR